MNQTLVIIPEYGKRELTLNCIHYIEEFTNQCYIVVGNDGYKDYEENEILNNEFTIEIVKNWENNVQFAENVNRTSSFGIEHYGLEDNDNIFIVNNDTILRNNAIDRMIKVLEDNPNFIIGPVLISSPNKMRKSGHGPNFQMMTEDVYLHANLSILPRTPTMISGAFIGMKVSTWKDLGGFDCQRFKAYYEDDDFGVRALIAGYKNYICYEAAVEHDFNSSYNINDNKTLALRIISKANFMNKWNPSNIIWQPDGFYSQEEIAILKKNDDRVHYREYGYVN